MSKLVRRDQFSFSMSYLPIGFSMKRKGKGHKKRRIERKRKGHKVSRDSETYSFSLVTNKNGHHNDDSIP